MPVIDPIPTERFPEYVRDMLYGEENKLKAEFRDAGDVDFEHYGLHSIFLQKNVAIHYEMKSTESVLNPRRTLQWLFLHTSYNTSPKLCRSGALWSLLYIATPFDAKCKTLEI